MTETEFLQWHAHHASIHTDYGKWLQTLGKEGKSSFLRSSQRALERTSLVAAVAVSDGLIDGRFDGPTEWNFNRGWNQTPRFVARIAFGLDNATTMKPPMASSGREETFRCVDCRDTGLLTCFSVASMQKLGRSPEARNLLLTLRDNPPPPVVRVPIPGDKRPANSLSRLLDEVRAGAEVARNDPAAQATHEAASLARSLGTMETICTCEAGDHKWSQFGIAEEDQRHDPRRCWRQNQRFNDHSHFACPMGDTVKHAAEFSEWLEERIENAAAERIKRQGNYTDAFSDFNGADKDPF